jgi:AmmeMemoRadiSam system protein A
MAIAAATQDLRFFPVQPEELKDLKYEISVLSPLKEIDDWKKIKVGRDGVEIVAKGRAGVFLPQVATENNWDLETFLSELCLEKLSLPKNCYQDKDAKLYTFTAQVFGEE